MYDRIILTGNQIKEDEDGSTLPSVLKINNTNYHTVNGQVATYNDKDKEYNLVPNTYLNGTIGDNIPEFSFEFAITDIDYSNNVKELQKKIYDDYYYSCPKDFITDRFKVYELSDYSAQAMTTKHYDFYVKPFVQYNTMEYKISELACVVIKSFTLKKAWLLVDNQINIKVTKIILDFIYKISSFTDLNKNSNLLGLFEINSKSPYHDKIYSIDESNVLLNKQGTYFKHIVDIQNNKHFSEDQYFHKVLEHTVFINSKEKHEDEEKTDNYVDYSVQYKTQPELKQKGYETYWYASDSNYLGLRLFTTSKSSGRYEIYKVRDDVIHYIMKYKKNTDDIKGYIHAWLKSNKQYLYNYDFQNLNIFEDGDSTYIEVYISFPYYKGINIIDEKTIKTIIGIDNYFEFANIDDPSDANDPTYYKGSSAKSYNLPIYWMDKYNIDTNYPILYAKDEETLNKPGIDSKFNIIKDADGEKGSFNFLTERDSDNLSTYMENNYFRSNAYLNGSSDDYMNTYEAKIKLINENLVKLIPSNSEFNSVNTNANEIDLSDCFFLVLRVEDTDGAYQTVKLKDTFGKIVYKRIYATEDYEDSDINDYIIISDGKYTKVVLDTNMTYIKIY